MLWFCDRNVKSVRTLCGDASGRWFAGLLILQWLSFLAATAFSTHPALSLNGSGWRGYGLVMATAALLLALLATAWLAVDHRGIRLLLQAASVTGGVAALYGIAQYFGFDPLLQAKAYEAGEGVFTIVRPPGTLGHADYFASFLLIAAFCSLALKHRAVFALVGLAILLSGTRSRAAGVAGWCGRVVLHGTTPAACAGAGGSDRLRGRSDGVLLLPTRREVESAPPLVD